MDIKNNLNIEHNLNTENNLNIENLTGDELNQKLEKLLTPPEDDETIRKTKEKLMKLI